MYNISCNISRRFEEADWTRAEKKFENWKNIENFNLARYLYDKYNIYNGKKGVTPWYFFFFFKAIDSYRVVYAILRLMALKTVLKYTRNTFAHYINLKKKNFSIFKEKRI